MIPEVKAKLLDGKRGLIVGIANDQSIAWGCAKAFRRWCRARRHLSQRQGEDACRAARTSGRGSDRDAARHAVFPGQLEMVFDRISVAMGQAHLRHSLECFSPKEALQGG